MLIHSFAHSFASAFHSVHLVFVSCGFETYSIHHIFAFHFLALLCSFHSQTVCYCSTRILLHNLPANGWWRVAKKECGGGEGEGGVKGDSSKTLHVSVRQRFE